MFNTHKCTFDDRGVCEQCITEQRRFDHFKDVYAPAANILHARIPDDLAEFPDAYEFGRMESGEWN
jgi:hypothetical protein